MGRSSNSRLQPLNLGQWAGEHQGIPAWGLRDTLLCLSEGQQAGGPQGAHPTQVSEPLSPSRRRSSTFMSFVFPMVVIAFLNTVIANKLTVMVRQAASRAKCAPSGTSTAPSACRGASQVQALRPRHPEGLHHVTSGPRGGCGGELSTTNREV